MDQFVRAVFRTVFGIDDTETQSVEIDDFNEEGQIIGKKTVELEFSVIRISCLGISACRGSH